MFVDAKDILVEEQSKWNWQTKFKPWTRLFALHFALMPSGNTRIHLFSKQSISNRWIVGKIMCLTLTNLVEVKLWIHTCFTSLCHTLSEMVRLWKYILQNIHWHDVCIVEILMQHILLVIACSNTVVILLTWKTTTGEWHLLFSRIFFSD